MPQATYEPVIKPAMKNEVREDKPVADQISDGIQGTDQPMEESHPMAPAALVFATYPITLAVALVVGAALVWFFR